MHAREGAHRGSRGEQSAALARPFANTEQSLAPQDLADAFMESTVGVGGAWSNGDIASRRPLDGNAFRARESCDEH